MSHLSRSIISHLYKRIIKPRNNELDYGKIYARLYNKLDEKYIPKPPQTNSGIYVPNIQLENTIIDRCSNSGVHIFACRQGSGVSTSLRKVIHDNKYDYNFVYVDGNAKNNDVGDMEEWVKNEIGLAGNKRGMTKLLGNDINHNVLILDNIDKFCNHENFESTLTHYAEHSYITPNFTTIVSVTDKYNYNKIMEFNGGVKFHPVWNDIYRWNDTMIETLIEHYKKEMNLSDENTKMIYNFGYRIRNPKMIEEFIKRLKNNN